MNINYRQYQLQTVTLQSITNGSLTTSMAVSAALHSAITKNNANFWLFAYS
ncbi:hypothetical protein [Aliikangiella sp. IMCC44359]|uniref:hypothetical protein n=1 Tax=Aliikangiella sp. IMCC44359 TaxID=3459125 RepID=UPI00403AD263